MSAQVKVGHSFHIGTLYRAAPVIRFRQTVMYISTPIMYSHAILLNGRRGVIMIVESGTSGATGTINLEEFTRAN